MGRQGKMFYPCAACIPTMYLLQAMAVATQKNRDLKISAFQLFPLKQREKAKLNQNCFVTPALREKSHRANQALSDLACDL